MVDTQDLIVVSGLVVMLVWFMTMMDGIFTGQYEPMQVSTPIMAIYAGFLFARGGLGKRGRDDE